MIFSVKSKNIVVLLFSSILMSCVTSSYKASAPNAAGTDIQVSPDRVITECEYISDYDGDRKEPYGFMIHVLDIQNTVLTVSNGVVLEKEYCLKRQAAADKIIHKANVVTVRGRGDADAPVERTERKHTFKEHGTYPGNGRSLNFLAIWNDKGQCYSAFNGDDDLCIKGLH